MSIDPGLIRRVTPSIKFDQDRIHAGKRGSEYRSKDGVCKVLVEFDDHVIPLSDDYQEKTSDEIVKCRDWRVEAHGVWR